MKDVFIGTSGFSYKHWKGTFYPYDLPSTKWFNYYFSKFGTVEINNTFYKMPNERTIQKWYETTPDSFLFTIKANRLITHLKKLKDTEEALLNFFNTIKLLKHKLGPILFQLPPSFKKDNARLLNFLEILPGDLMHVFEFRNVTWFSNDTYETLKQYNAAFCIYELAGLKTDDIITAKHVYLRFHGPTQNKYQGSYSDEVLSSIANSIRNWNKENKKVFCYFDNDDSGYAAFNAMKLQEFLF